MNEPRVYKNSPFVFGLLFVMLAVLVVAFFFAAGDSDFSNPIVMIAFMLSFGFLFIFLIFKATAQTIISNDEIVTKNLLGKKSLNWSEIERVSGSGYRIKLQNNSNMSIAPSPQLPGYTEVIEQLGIKRPDLFNHQEYSEMTRGWAGAIASLAIWFLLLFGLSLFVVTQANDILIPFLVFIVFGLIAIVMQLAPPKSIIVQGNSIVISYLFNKKTLTANEIVSINLLYTQTRYGKNYFVAINHAGKGTIRVSALRPNLPVVYLVLKNWHARNTKLV